MNIVPYIFFPEGRIIAIGASFLCVLIAFVWSFSVEYDDLQADSYHTTFVLDVSLSMNTYDGNEQKQSRLSVAKNAIQDIIKSSTHEFGLTVFSGSPERVIPHTSGRGIFLTFLSWVDRRNVAEGGTNISLAIEEAILDFQTGESGNIIVLTDGGDEDIGGLESLSRVLSERNISLFIVWVGTESGDFVPQWVDDFGRIVYKLYKWQKVLSQLDVKGLNNLATKLWAEYYHVSEISRVDIWSDILDNSAVKSSVWWSILLGFLFWLYFLWGLIYHKKYSWNN